LQAKTAVSRGCSIVFIDKCGAHSKHFAAKRPTARPARLHQAWVSRWTDCANVFDCSRVPLVCQEGFLSDVPGARKLRL